MKVVEVFGHNYGIENDHGKLVASGFRTAQDAWDWIDLYRNPERADEILKRKLADLKE